MNRLIVVIAALIAIVTGETALAQSNSCGQLQRQLQSLDRDGDFRNIQQYSGQLRDATNAQRRLESTFVRSGCNRMMQQGQRLPRECNQLIRQIQRVREDVATLGQRLSRGQAVAQAREDVLQQIARFGCQTGSNVTIRERDRGGFLERLFGGFSNRGNDIIGEEFDPFGGMSTLRTVCVRKQDGYYWPISYSTVDDYLYQDADACQASCPTADVELYYYHIPGEDVDSMINLAGERYVDLPTAFQYRREYSAGFSCKQQINYGSIKIAEDGDETRAIVTFEDRVVPMPRRDPRRTTEIVVAEATFVPLPRPRPTRNGESPRATPVVVTQADLRVVEVDGKQIRIIGPDTPYVPTPAEGS